MAANTNEEYWALLYRNLSLRETEDLLEIYKHGAPAEWDEATFEVIKQILQDRGEPIPAQSSKPQRARPGRTEVTAQKMHEFPSENSADRVEIIQPETPDELDETDFEAMDHTADRVAPDSQSSARVQFDQISNEVDALLDAEDWPGLLEHANRLVELLPEDPEGYALRAMALEELDQLELALLNLQTSLHLDPDQKYIWEEWLDVTAELERRDQALTVECDFEQSPACLALDRALDLIQDDRVDEALAEIEAALPDLPKIALAYNYLGQIYEEMGKVEPALDAYRTAIRCNPRFFAARENLANALIRWEAEQYRLAACLPDAEEDLPEYTHADWEGSHPPVADDLLPEWFYLDETAFWLRGWPGNRTRSGRIGLDPLDRDFELAHMEGVVLHRLFTGRFRTQEPFHFIVLIGLGLIYCTPIILMVGDPINLVSMLIISIISGYPIVGILIAINLFRSFLSDPTFEDEESGKIYY